MVKRYRPLLLALLLDIGLINLAFALAYQVRYNLQFLLPLNDAFYAPYTAYLPTQFWYTVLMLLFLYLDGAYAVHRGDSWFNEVYRIVNASTTVGIIQFAAIFFILPTGYSRGLILEAIALTIAFLSAARLVQRVVQAQLRRRGHGVDRVLIVGAGEAGRSVMRSIVALPELGYQVAGFVDDDPGKGDIGRFKALGGLDAVEELLKSERVTEVIITLPWMYQRRIISLVRVCEACQVRVRVVPDLFQLSLSRVDMAEIGGIPLIGFKETAIPRAGRVVKRVIDIILTLVSLLVAGPLMVLVALLVRL